MVASAKGDNRGFCLRCYYVARGSIGKLKFLEVLKLLRRSPPLQRKLAGKH